LQAIAVNVERLRGRVAAVHAQRQLGGVLQAHVDDAERLLTRLQKRLDTIEETNDVKATRDLVQRLVSGIKIETELGEGGRKHARITINFD
jgi:hypothetical protein